MFNDTNPAKRFTDGREENLETTHEAIHESINGGGISSGPLSDHAFPTDHEDLTPIMSTDLVQIHAPRSEANLEPSTIDDSVQADMSLGGITFWDLPRIGMRGGPRPHLIVPTLEGDVTADSIEVTIVNERDIRSYYKTPFGKGGKPPDCASTDGITGRGLYAGKCSECRMAQYGSAEGGQGQACKQRKNIIALCEDQQLRGVSLPPTSLKGAMQLRLMLLNQKLRPYQARISISARKAQDGDYGIAALRYVRKLTPEEAQISWQWHEFFRKLDCC
jgi:hypothetical protein